MSQRRPGASRIQTSRNCSPLVGVLERHFTEPWVGSFHLARKGNGIRRGASGRTSLACDSSPVLDDGVGPMEQSWTYGGGAAGIPYRHVLSPSLCPGKGIGHSCDECIKSCDECIKFTVLHQWSLVLVWDGGRKSPANTSSSLEEGSEDMGISEVCAHKAQGRIQRVTTAS